jgi:parvulin-like peptidyl-prolyl isomerase
LLENLIDRELLIQEAKRQGVTIGTARVLRRIERLPDQMRPKAAAADASGTPTDGVALGEDAFFRYVHEGLLIERLLEMELPKVSAVSEKRARAYYEENPGLFMHPEEVHLRHILVQAPPEMAADAHQQAYLQIQALAQQLAEGANFTALAIDASQCPSRARGGDLGFLTRQQLYPSLAQAAFDLAPGQVSPIVESPAGYHLLLVTDRRPARQLSFLLVRDDLQKQLRTERLHKAARSFIRKLREQAAIERFLR